VFVVGGLSGLSVGLHGGSVGGYSGGICCGVGAVADRDDEIGRLQAENQALRESLEAISGFESERCPTCGALYPHQVLAPLSTWVGSDDEVSRG